MKGITFVLDATRQYRAVWIAYALKSAVDGSLQYAGHCQLQSMLAIPDAKKHPKFNKTFLDPKHIIFEVLEVFETRTEAKAFINSWLYQRPRPLMLQYHRNLRGKVKIRCLDTGEVFESLTAAAQSHQVATSALSNHLNGNPNYKTVGGFTYEHISEEVSFERG